MDEIADPHQGFNTGTVYPRKVGESYIYEGMILRFLKSMWGYQDATNIVGLYPEGVQLETVDIGKGLEHAGAIRAPIDAGFLPGLQDPDSARQKISSWQAKGYMKDRLQTRCKKRARPAQNPRRASSLWVYRYRLKPSIHEVLRRPIEESIAIICDVTGAERVNIIAHSMGGLVARAMIQDPEDDYKQARERINKFVTLGTPHKGIAFQYLPDILIDRLPQISGELDQFNPRNQAR